MDTLTSAILRCDLKLALDNRTEGFGDCFPNAIVQQCRRPEVKAWLMKNKPSAIFTSPQTLRLKVKTFALQSNDEVVTNLRAKYEREIQPVDKKSWEDYWDLMGRKGTWVDHIFVQMTAWYMNLDIMVLTTSSQSENPFIHLNGNIKETSGNPSGPPLILGNYTNVHYQSLIPHDHQDKTKTMTKKQHPTNQIIPEEEKTEDQLKIQLQTFLQYLVCYKVWEKVTFTWK